MSYIAWIIAWPLAGVAVALACSFIPPFHTLTQEFTALFTILTSVAAFFLSAKLARSRDRRRFPHAIGLATACAGSAAVAGLATVGALNYAIRSCAFEAGIPHFIVTWIPATLFAIISGVFLGLYRARLRMQIGVLCVFTLFSAVHDGLQLYFGPRIYPLDLFLGDVSRLMQRGGIEIPAAHAWGRAYLVLLSVTLLLWASWQVFWKSIPRKPRTLSLRSIPIASSILCIFVAVIWGSYIGVGVDRRNLHTAYPFVETTEHFKIHYAGDPLILDKLDAVVRQIEWDFHYITRIWERSPDRRIQLYLFESPEAMARFTGTQYAHGGIGEVFVDVATAMTGALRHELVHALHQTLEPSPFILMSRGIMEGTAVAFQGEYAIAPAAHAMQAAALQNETLPPMRGVLSPMGFRSVSEVSAYESAGSFLGFLVMEYGMDPFVEWQRSLKFQKAYGKTLEDLDQEWRTFLAKVPVPPEEKLRGSFLYDSTANPSYFSQQCPKVGERRDPIQAEAKHLFALGRFSEARPLYEKLYDQERDIAVGRTIAECLSQEENYQGAGEFLQEILERKDLKDYERAVLIQDLIVASFRHRNWEQLYETYEIRSAMDAGVPESNTMGETCLRDPLLREDYAAVHFEEDPIQREAIWQRMKDARPGFEPLLYVYAVSGAGVERGLEPRAEALLQAARFSARLANMVAPQMQNLYKEAFAERRYDIVRSLCEALITKCSDERYRLQGEMGRQRLEFELQPEESP